MTSSYAGVLSWSSPRRSLLLSVFSTYAHVDLDPFTHSQPQSPTTQQVYSPKSANLARPRQKTGVMNPHLPAVLYLISSPIQSVDNLEAARARETILQGHEQWRG